MGVWSINGKFISSGPRAKHIKTLATMIKEVRDTITAKVQSYIVRIKYSGHIFGKIGEIVYINKK